MFPAGPLDRFRFPLFLSFWCKFVFVGHSISPTMTSIIWEKGRRGVFSGWVHRGLACCVVYTAI